MSSCVVSRHLHLALFNFNHFDSPKDCPKIIVYDTENPKKFHTSAFQIRLCFLILSAFFYRKLRSIC